MGEKQPVTTTQEQYQEPSIEEVKGQTDNDQSQIEEEENTTSQMSTSGEDIAQEVGEVVFGRQLDTIEKS